MDGLEELARRIAQLDAGPGKGLLAGTPHAELAHFITVLERVTDSRMYSDACAPSCKSPSDADDLVKSSRLLEECPN